METKKETLEEIKDKLLQRLIAKYPELEYDVGIRYGQIPQKYEKEYQKWFDEEIKKSDIKQGKKTEESKKPDEVEELKKQLEEKNKKIEELTDSLKRLAAEFENYKKWSTKEKTDFVKYAHADIIAKMLTVLDSFEIALKNTNDKEKFIEGIKIIYAQLYSVLEAEGLKPIKATGEKFDPYKHEVLMKQESDSPDDTVLEEFQKGYMLNDKVLRHSKVKVSGK